MKPAIAPGADLPIAGQVGDARFSPSLWGRFAKLFVPVEDRCPLAGLGHICTDECEWDFASK
jgi:hypothetical protein